MNQWSTSSQKRKAGLAIHSHVLSVLYQVKQEVDRFPGFWGIFLPLCLLGQCHDAGGGELGRVQEGVKEEGGRREEKGGRRKEGGRRKKGGREGGLK